MVPLGTPLADAAEMRRTLPSFFDALDAVRLINLSGSTGYGVGTGEGQGKHPSWPDTLLGGADELRGRLGDSPAATQAFDVGHARLRDLVPYCPADRHLIHGDLLHHNILASDGRITAFLVGAARASVTSCTTSPG